MGGWISAIRETLTNRRDSISREIRRRVGEKGSPPIVFVSLLRGDKRGEILCWNIYTSV